MPALASTLLLKKKYAQYGSVLFTELLCDDNAQLMPFTFSLLLSHSFSLALSLNYIEPFFLLPRSQSFCSTHCFHCFQFCFFFQALFLLSGGQTKNTVFIETWILPSGHLLACWCTPFFFLLLFTRDNAHFCCVFSPGTAISALHCATSAIEDSFFSLQLTTFFYSVWDAYVWNSKKYKRSVARAHTAMSTKYTTSNLIEIVLAFFFFGKRALYVILLCMCSCIRCIK